MKKDKAKIIPVAVIVAAVLITAGTYIRGKSGGSGRTIFVSGNIEVTEVRVAFQAAGRIKELLTDEGMAVKEGDILARLDKDELTRAKAQAEAALEESRFSYERLKEDHIRAENLFSSGAISTQKRDAARTSADMAGAKVDTLTAARDLAAIRLGYADLISPINGYVLVKSYEAGEVVQVGAPVFTLADLKDSWLTAYINETDLGRVKLNQDVRVKTDTYPKKTYKGRVSFISGEAEFTPKQIQTKEERAKLVYRIKITIDNPEMELKPGMPADAYIDVRQP